MFCSHSSEMWGSPGRCLLAMIVQIVCEKWSWVTYLVLLVPPFVTLNCHVEVSG
jgi:hypothetical protein